jgi:hypothetical protein
VKLEGGEREKNNNSVTRSVAVDEEPWNLLTQRKKQRM